MVDSTDGEGFTGLMHASFNGDLRSVLLLLAGGASPNVANNYGDSPLMVATLNNQSGVVSALIDGGANKRATNQSGDSAQSLAERFGYQDLLAILARDRVPPQGGPSGQGGAAATALLEAALARVESEVREMKRQLDAKDRECELRLKLGKVAGEGGPCVAVALMADGELLARMEEIQGELARRGKTVV